MSENGFFERVASLDSGCIASLKRSAGTMLNETDGKAFTAFYKAYPPDFKENSTAEEKYFFAACMQCLWKSEDLSKAVPIEKVFAAITKDSDDEDIYLRRIKVLIDLNWDSYMATKLCRLIKLCRSKGFVVDCAVLADDLIKWNYTDKRVQKKWARAICGTLEIINKTEGDK